MDLVWIISGITFAVVALVAVKIVWFMRWLKKKEQEETENDD